MKWTVFVVLVFLGISLTSAQGVAPNRKLCMPQGIPCFPGRNFCCSDVCVCESYGKCFCEKETCKDTGTKCDPSNDKCCVECFCPMFSNKCECADKSAMDRWRRMDGSWG